MKTGFCSGTFHFPHVGHLLFFEDCKKYCDYLTVMIASDYDIRIKYGCEPKLAQELRFKAISEWKPVDRCFVSEEIPAKRDLRYLFQILGELRPDIYFVNEDAYDLDQRVDYCNRVGIEIKVLSRRDNDSGFSSSRILNKASNSSSFAE